MPTCPMPGRKGKLKVNPVIRLNFIKVAFMFVQHFVRFSQISVYVIILNILQKKNLIFLLPELYGDKLKK